MSAQQSINAQASVGATAITVSASLSVAAGPYVVIAKLVASTANQGTLACQLRAGSVALDDSAAYLSSSAAGLIPMSLAGAVTLTTGPQPLGVVCQVPDGGTVDVSAIQLIAMRMNSLDTPN